MVAENSYSHHVNCAHIEKLKNNLINLQSTEPWQVCPPDKLGNWR